MAETTWPGIVKLAEEAGEVVQVCAKLIAFPRDDHPDGAGSLRDRLSDEIADVLAACSRVIEANGLDHDAIRARCERKLERFRNWGTI